MTLPEAESEVVTLIDDEMLLGSWWQLFIVASTVISVAYAAIFALIIIPILRSGQVRTNRFGVATAAIFLSCSVAFGLSALQTLLAVVRGDDNGLAQHNSWWLAAWYALAAVVAVYYLTLRSHYERLSSATLLHDSRDHKQPNLEEVAALNSARDEAEAQRDKHASMMQTMINNSQSIVYVKDLEGVYLLTTPLFNDFFGLKHGEIIGHTDAYFGAAPSPAWRNDDLSARVGRQESEEWWAGPDGVRCYHTVKFPLHDGQGVLYATCSIAVDVTEKREAAAKEVERDAALAAAEAKASFLATMSHEIRTPLNAVIGMTDLLSDTNLDGHQRELVHTVKSSGEALLLVINDILDFSKIESGELQLEAVPFALRTEAERSLDMVLAQATGKGLELVCDVEPDGQTWVQGDAHRFRQILVNLLSNAVKFTEQGEVVLSLHAEPVEADHVHLLGSVSDTGIGIPPDRVDQLFQSFTQVDASITRTHGGSGLGLAISRNLARAMGGDLTLADSSDAGSTFLLDVTFPACPPPSAAADEQSAAELACLVGRSALLVDDNATNLRILDLKMGGLGMHCHTFNSPLDALAAVAKGVTYDVAVLDMHMPEMDGLTLGNALKGMQHQHAPLVLLTSLGWKPAGLERSFAAFLTKPAKQHAFNQALIRVLSGGADEVSAPVHESVSPIRPLKILLAEDNRINQRMAKLMLERLGHHVDTVTDGHEAVAAATRQAYDIVLMDVQMPVMDGLEATRQIRAQLPQGQSPYIVALTANALTEDRQACLEAGMQNYLSKPVRLHELEHLISSSTVDRRPATDETTTEAIDEALLRGLMLQVNGDPEAQRSLIDDYLTESDDILQMLTAALAARDRRQVRSLAHTWRSTCALLGAVPLATLLQQVEHDDESATSGQQLSQAIEVEYERVKRSLNRLKSAALN
ncbi:MAG TPA: response regulator [Propionibacteriaceae bacterium]